MTYTLGFDVYGTLIDTHGIVGKLSKLVDCDPRVFSQTWRDKQLEYSFRRGLMQLYADFSVCTAEALDYACQFHQQNLSKTDRSNLLAFYSNLPAFPDAQDALTSFQDQGHNLYAFSNGSKAAVTTVLENAGILSFFTGVISVEDVATFKPNPSTYAHFLRTTKCYGSEGWLISSNPFDIIGAHSAGMRTAWIQRQSNAIFDPWGITPTVTSGDLINLAQKFKSDADL